MTKLVTSLGSTEQRQKEIELMEMDLTLRQKEIEDKQILREQYKQWGEREFEERKTRRQEEKGWREKEIEEKKIGRKETPLYAVRDAIKKQRIKIWKTRNQFQDSALADYMEEELKTSEEEAKALELEIQCIQKPSNNDEAETPKLMSKSVRQLERQF